MEWVPAQGFLLPTALARELAGYLAGIPDEVCDDDQMTAVFCRERGIPVVATVPSLIDNARPADADSRARWRPPRRGPGPGRDRRTPAPAPALDPA